MTQYRMLDNIRDHSVMVSRVAEALVAALNKTGENLSCELAVAAALLHDIGKTACLNTDRDHARLGRDICLEHDMEEIAVIVAEHVVLKNGLPSFLSEKEIVYYADKRVTHDEIVSLDNRLEYLLERYGQGSETLRRSIMKNYGICQELETKLFENLPFAPAEIDRHVNHAESGYCLPV